MMASNMVPTGALGGSSSSAPGRGPTWQDAQADSAIRQKLKQHIVAVFSKKRAGQMQSWGSKLNEFVQRLEQELYRTARSKEEYTDLTTLEQRLQQVARQMNNNGMNSRAGQQGMQSSMQPALPPGMVPNPGQMGAQHMPPSSGSMNFQGQPNGMGPAGMPGFIPTPSMGPPFSNDDAMRGGMGNAGPSTVSPMVPMESGINGMVPTSNGFPNPPGMMPTPMMRSNSQRDSGYGMGGQLMNGSNGVGPNQRMSMNGMQHNGMGSMMSGPQPSGFIPTANTSLPPPGMMPVPNSGMMPNQPMMGMGGMQGPGPGSGMVPMGNMGMPAAPFPGMHGNMPPMPPAPPAPGMPGPGDMGDPAQWGNAPAPPGNNGDMTDAQRAQYVQKQQRWLLFLRHCAKCRQSESECQLQQQCKFGKQLWQHILHCASSECEYPRCHSSKDLLKHHQKCQSPTCPICTPVKDYVRKTRMQQQQQQAAQQGGTGPMGGMVPPGMVPNSNMTSSSYPAPPPPSTSGQKRNHTMMNGYPHQPTPSASMGGMMPVPGGPTPPGQPAFAPPGDDQMQKRPRPDGEQVIHKNTGTSLLETFSKEQIRLHKEGIWNAQSQQRNAQAQIPNPDDLCKVCGCIKLLFEPPVLYCSMCNLKIKRGQTYYCTPTDKGAEVRGCWCHQCFTEAKDRIPIMGSEQGVKKAELTKHKNDAEIEEPWVQCDHCSGWVHQICGLFNKGRNNSETHYLCPECLILGLETGQRQRIEQRPQAMLEAKDLPHCELSRFLEGRISEKIDKERRARALKENKKPEEVVTADGLTVRVVNSIMKKCETKSKFYEVFGPEEYASEFPYRQRVLLLFQNLDGVDVCIFCMYVQEYGAECPLPNRNCVYLSYLDSIKYFRPELNAVIPGGGGVPNTALRTYVYHQLLIGYLVWVRMLGFEQMYIWACPPMQGDDYILYCHPNKQKTPRSDRLRAWYLDMLRQAKQEQIVQHITTLWDTYFPGGRDHRLERCSATHIPYLEGDYWPGEAENQLANIQDGQRQANKASNTKGQAGALARKSGKGKRYGGGANSDEQLMDKLGEILGGNMKEDFIVAHLQEVCTFCRTHVLGGSTIFRYRAPGGAALKSAPERKFDGIKLETGPNVPVAPVTQLNICQSCFEDEYARHRTPGAKVRLPANVSPADLHAEKLEHFSVVRDTDGEVENEFFETRQSFLSLCQGNHYQFDTMRRAKHSSMMVLYHIHNPTAPAFTSSCNVCNVEIEAGTGFRCTVCPDFDICLNCKTNRGHEHPVVKHEARKYDETRMRLTEQERRERNEQLQQTMRLLVHACSCQNPQCNSNSCRKVRQLFQHAVACQHKVTGGCQMCKKMWCLLNLHAKSCTRSDCPVPRCKELKELRRRQTARQEEKRRKAYQNMLRQQMLSTQGGH